MYTAGSEGINSVATRRSINVAGTKHNLTPILGKCTGSIDRAHRGSDHWLPICW